MTPSSLPQWPREADYTFTTVWTDASGAQNTDEPSLDVGLYKAACYEAAMARLRYLVNEIKAHDQACDKMCGLGDQEGVACKYRPYFPRHCPSCPKDDKLDHWLEAIGELPPTATP